MFTSHQTIHTNSVGQYLYCAPEQFMLLKDGDFRSDVYLLGIETITDKYQGYYKQFGDYDNLANIMFKIITGKYEFPIKELATRIL